MYNFPFGSDELRAAAAALAVVVVAVEDEEEFRSEEEDKRFDEGVGETPRWFSCVDDGDAASNADADEGLLPPPPALGLWAMRLAFFE